MIFQAFRKKIAWYSALKNSDPEAIQYLINSLQPSVVKRLLRYGVTDDADAEDIFMRVVEGIYRKIYQGKEPFFDDHRFEAYLLSACKKQWQKEIAKKRRVSLVTSEDLAVLKSGENPLKAIIQKEQVELLWEKFQQLGHDCQTVLRLFVIEKHSHQAIADQLDYTYDYAKKKKYRCLRKLAEMIREEPLFKK